MLKPSPNHGTLWLHNIYAELIIYYLKRIIRLLKLQIHLVNKLTAFTLGSTQRSIVTSVFVINTN